MGSESIPFKAEIKNKDGQITTQNMNLRVIQVERQAQQQKTSNILPQEDQFTYQDIIEAPYDLKHLTVLEEHSNVLRECIDAMVTNIAGHGYMYRPRKVSEEIQERHESEIENEKIFLDGWLDAVCPETSFTENRKRMRRDLELTGNGYFEIVRSPDKVVWEINHVRSHSMRLTKLDDNTTPYIVPVIRPAEDYKIEEIEKSKRFRRYLQVDSTGNPVIYFKEFGDPRTLNKYSGEEDSGAALNDQATEMMHFTIYSPRSPYGIPRWVGRYVSILGSRRSEEVNYFTLSNNHVPSMFIMLENGALTGPSVQRLTDLIESQVATDPNYSKIVILEAEAGENESFAGQVSRAKMSIYEPKSARIEDQMFQKYDGNNQEKVRLAFRLPPLLVGRADDYTRATASASVRVSDEQIFHPAREPVNHFMTRLMLDQGFRWHSFRTRTPNITDNETLVKMMVAAEKSGAMTPFRADVIAQDAFEGELGPMPQGVDTHTPYSLQFAQAQNAQRPPEGQAAETETTERKIDWTDEYLDTILRGID
jgi:PBSX family phage portal protein